MMKLVRSPEAPEAVGYATAEKRYSVVLRAEVETDGSDEHVWVRVINISAGGLMIVAPPEAVLAGKLTLTIRHIGRLSGHIAWTKDNCFGVKFDEAIDPEALMSERAKRAGASADESQEFVKNTARLFVRTESEDEVLPFVAMMRAKSANRPAA
jgi:hypothetical protein